MKTLLSLAALFASSLILAQNDSIRNPSLVDYDAFIELALEVKSHREERLLTVEQFNKMSSEAGVLILDTRSKEMYDAKHIKGAIHLNFSDFTQTNLERLIPTPETKILIYCNNNIDDDQKYFMTKSYNPRNYYKDEKALTLALNIPTYINLYGYGYRNVYELGELISYFDGRIQFEGSAVNSSSGE